MIAWLCAGMPRNARVLDVGCSGGLLMEQLKREGFRSVFGIDISEAVIAKCKQKNIENVFVMDGSRTQFANDSFDLIIASDILEHIADDAVALREWRRILKPGGTLIVFVPAFKILWSHHDVVNKHFKRYTRQELVHKLKSVGFLVSRASYWNAILFLPTLAFRIVQNFSKALPREGNLQTMHPAVNKLFLSIVRLENFLLRKLNFCFGVSVFAVAEKKDSHTI